MILKVLGVLMIVFGVFFFVKFPGISAHQKTGMTKASLTVSGISIIAGLLLLLVG